MHSSRTEQNIGTTISCFVVLLLSTYLMLGIFGIANEIFVLSGIGILFLAFVFFSFFIQYRLRKKNKFTEIDYLNVGVQRHILGLFMVFYGVPKLFGNFFDYQLSALDARLVEVSEFELAWYFFGKNRWQELFTGIMEFVPGILLFKRRTYYLASVILLPVTAQVFTLNLFYKIGGVTFPAASILLACNLYIIYSRKEKIISFFKSLEFYPDVKLNRKITLLIKLCRWGIMALVLLIIIARTSSVFLKSGYQIKYESLVGAYTLAEMKKNNKNYKPGSEDLYYKDLYIEKQSRWNMIRRFNNNTDACVFELNSANDSMTIYINKGGTGDGPDMIDTLTALRGVYKLENNMLTITGVQLKDTLELKYIKQNLKPKEWFW